MNQPARNLARQQHFLVPDVRCAGCCLKIERELGRIQGVDRINVNYADRRLSFETESVELVAAVLDKIHELGYSTAPDSKSEGLAQFHDQRRHLLARLGVAGIGMMQVMMFALAGYVAGPDGIDESYTMLMRWASLVVSVPVVFYAALPFHRGALRDIRNRTAGMDVPVSLAICAAFVLSAIHTVMATGEVYFDSACMFTFFLLSGRFLELTARHSFEVEESLGEHLLPEKAERIDGSLVSPALLRADDLLRVAPGGIIPADGLVQHGVTSVDESAFTGETRPVIRHVGSRVLAGSKNLDGELVIRVTGDQQEWVITHLGELYRQSATYKPRFALMADVIARYFVVTVLFLSASAGVYWWWQGGSDFVAVALAVLVVSCPCALSLATPVAYSIASGAVHRLGILIRSGEFLEKLGMTSAVVFDKTGTLTEGALQLERIQPVDRRLESLYALDVAAALERDSLHPIAVSLREAAGSYLEPDKLDIQPGLGVSGHLHGHDWRLGRPDFAAEESVPLPDGSCSWILLSRDGKPACWFAFRDRWREGVTDAVVALRELGLRVDAFSGDSSEEGRSGLVVVGIPEPVMNMSPDQKIDAIGRLQADHERVLMVGDGLNDAGAMARADISLAVNPVDTLVQSAADATLVNGDVAVVPELIRYALRVRKVIRQNICWALVYNFTVIPLAIAGMIAPWAAALGMSASSLLVTLNACRLGKVS